MPIDRKWITPLIAGAFLLSAATGVLIFFHLDSGANKLVHEWLSWVLLAGAGLHVTVNWKAFVKHVTGRPGMLVVGAFAVLLAVSFIPLRGKDGPPFAAPIRALAHTPLATLAQVAQIPPQELFARLAKAGVPATSEQQTLSNLVGEDPKRQLRVLQGVFSPQANAR